MNFAKAVVKYRIPILILALVLSVPAFFGMAGTRINYDSSSPAKPVRIARISINSHSAMPKAFASRAIRTLNSPSAKMDIPSAMKMKFITSVDRTRTISPSAIRRILNLCVTLSTVKIVRHQQPDVPEANYYEL